MTVMLKEHALNLGDLMLQALNLSQVVFFKISMLFLIV